MYIRVVFLFSLFAFVTSKSELSCRLVRAFVDGHNSRRMQLAKGEVPNQPAASEMKYVIWDEELAAKATKWASRNEFAHNPDRSVGSNRFGTGENIFMIGTNNFSYKFEPKSALDSWFSEHKDYSYGPLKASQFQSSKMIGHYTQMVWSDSVYLGCGVSKYRRNGMINYMVVCNYGPTGNYLGMTPYPSNGKAIGKLTCATDDCSKSYGDKC